MSDFLHDRFAFEERLTQVTLDDILHPVEVLLPKRVRKSQLFHEALAIMRAQFGKSLETEHRHQGIPGQHIHGQKDQDGY
jgi:hypothetical protein